MAVSVVILAAGAGTRMKSATPKVLHSLSGRPLIDYSVLAAKSISDDIQVILYHEAERVEKHLNAVFPGLTLLRQDHLNFPGTGGAIKAAKPKYDQVAVLNGDMPLITPEFVQKLAASSATVTLSTFEHPAPTGYGRVILDGDRVVAIVEEKDATEAQKRVQTVNAGVYAFNRAFLENALPRLSNQNAQKEYYITDLIGLAAAEGKSVAAVSGDQAMLMGVNSKAELAEAETLHQRRLKTDWMKAGVIMRLPETIFIDSRATFEGECELEPGVMIKGACKIVRSSVKAHSVIEDSVLIDSDAGPMARIRPQSELIGTHIGNFVEVKKSKLTGVKAGHLSYLGDATIDEGTNVGAGTITCNYDGKGKHQTIIGKNVFIGSDTQLVAPVNIPDNVLIAAGTTVTKNPQSGDLVLSRTPQKSVAGFFERFFGKKA
ncbi:MAG: bifunctional UDP-N-acetylglucosamine diphosphorylase/glucosamine-1-phosphate N-acetyltransferase GlmU [Campylobacterales bacterium]